MMTCGASGNEEGQKNSETWCLKTGLDTGEETRLRGLNEWLSNARGHREPMQLEINSLHCGGVQGKWMN
jgi:hypothetical protein